MKNKPYFRLFNIDIKRCIEYQAVETTLSKEDEALNGRSFTQGRKDDSVVLTITLKSSGNTTDITNEQIIEQIRQQIKPIT